MLEVSRGRFGKGGIFSARVHPRIKQILRGVKQESNLRREGITRFNKRWRSWAIRTVRQQAFPRQVVLTSDPALMDSEYLCACMHKAACQDIKDLELWGGYINRFETIASQVPATQFGYVAWSIGKLQVPNKRVYAILISRAEELLPELTSSGLMSVLWTLERALVKPPISLLEGIAKRVLVDSSNIRPSDYIKICNSLAFFGYGKNDSRFRDEISAVSISKFEKDVFAQDFRSALDPIALVNLWNDEARVYILDRFRRIFITARPNHLLSAYHSSVAVRVLAPTAWFDHLSEKTRGFYTSLAMRHIATRSRSMSRLHKEVSETLAGSPLRLPHRNMFRWGPFWIDIGIEDITEESCSIEDDRKSCLIIDKPTSFYSNSKREFTEKSKIEHNILSQIGWKVFHVNHYMWDHKCRTQEQRVEYLKKTLGSEPQLTLLDTSV
jgi:hypothetical protein